ncbi:hypothetical protein ABC733_03415 [Mangrovibacter sp. SLW1]
MRFLLFVLFFTLGSSCATASPYSDDVLFGCFFNSQKVPKEAVVLRSSDTVTYLYGKQGDNGVIPEITVRKNVSQLTQSWHNSRSEGVSLYELSIPNGQYAYNIGYTSKGGKTSGDIGIYKNGEYVSSLTCTDVWENNLDSRELMQGIPDADERGGSIVSAFKTTHTPTFPADTG